MQFFATSLTYIAARTHRPLIIRPRRSVTLFEPAQAIDTLSYNTQHATCRFCNGQENKNSTFFRIRNRSMAYFL